MSGIAGWHQSLKIKKKLSQLRTGENNPNWKGDNVKYGSLHDYIKWHFPKSDLCMNCHLLPSYDLCNISGKYKRDLSDWEWLCRRCHMLKDGRLDLFKSKHRLSKEKHPNWKGGKPHCKVCNKTLTNYGTNYCIKHSWTKEHKNKMSLSRKGHKMSEEIKKKISLANKITSLRRTRDLYGKFL